MYKIYFNNKLIVLTHWALHSLMSQSTKNSVEVFYKGKTKLILSCLDKLEKNTELKALYLLADDVEALWSDFKSLFKWIEAAGGLVINDRQEMLLIFRRGHWDLPKGKLENNETILQGAEREVLEETGLSEVKTLHRVINTYHIYDTKKHRVLKKSYWYMMYAPHQKLIPQTEEDIEVAKWVKVSDFDISRYSPIYSNIEDVIRACLHIRTL